MTDRARRLQSWESGQRPMCENHPYRTVNQQAWVEDGKRLCWTCYHNPGPAYYAAHSAAQRRYSHTLNGHEKRGAWRRKRYWTDPRYREREIVRTLVRRAKQQVYRQHGLIE